MRIDAVTEDLGAQFANLIRRVSKENIVSITDFISSMKLEINISYHHKGNFIKILQNYPNSVMTSLSRKSKRMT
jgi:hypothetical protein